MRTSITQQAVPAAASTLAHAAAAVAAAGFVAIACFQVALALGAPLGRAAWGGGHVHLPPGLRIASAVAAAVWVLAALVVLGRGGYGISPLSHNVSSWGTWVLVGALTLGALMNLASPSIWERFLMSPVALLLAVLCFIVARSGAGSSAAA